MQLKDAGFGCAAWLHAPRTDLKHLYVEGLEIGLESLNLHLPPGSLLRGRTRVQNAL